MAKQKPRQQVAPLPTPKPVTPKAQPVNTYHTPFSASAPEKRNTFLEFAAGIEHFRPGFESYLDVKKKVADEASVAEGGKQALLESQRGENRRSFQGMVDAGVIPAGASPWFVKGYKMQRMRLDAQNYDQELKTAYESDPVRNSDDPGEFAEFAQKHLQEFSSKLELQGDPEYSQTFLPIAANAQMNLHLQHTAQRQRAIEEETKQNTETEIGNILDQSKDRTKATSLINDLDAMQRAHGMSGDDLNQAKLKALIRKAEESHDTRYLDMAMDIPAGSGPLGKIGYARELLNKARIEINNRSLSLQSQQYDWDKKLTARKSQEWLDAAAEHLEVNPEADDHKLILSALDVGGEDLASKFRTYARLKRGDDAAIRERPEDTADLWTGLYSGAYGESAVWEMAGQKKINSETVKSALAHIRGEEADKASGKKSMYQHDHVKHFANSIFTSVAGKDNEKAGQAAEAQRQLYSHVAQYFKAHPDQAGDPEKVWAVSQAEFVSQARKNTVQGVGNAINEDTDSNEDIELNPQTIGFMSDDEARLIDTRKQLVFRDIAEADAAARTYKTTRGGILLDLSRKLGKDPKQLITDQTRILRTQKKPAQATTPKK